MDIFSFSKPTLRGIGKIVDYYIWGGGGGGDTFVLHYKNKNIYKCHLGNFLLKICHCNAALYH